MASIEELLLMRAAEDAAAVPTSVEAASIGAALGATGGALMGAPINDMGRGLNTLMGRQTPVFAPGARMAGGLVGLILGGGLGMGIRQQAINDSPAAKLLAKAQVQGDLDAGDRKQLERIIGQIYSEMGLR